MSAAEQGEPTGALERVEYYRAILDETPEYWILTREARQIWTIAEAVQELHLSAHGLRSAFADSLLPGPLPCGEPWERPLHAAVLPGALLRRGRPVAT